MGMDRSAIGAAYCVYENSGFLQESIRRIYPLMKKILILLNFRPWNGEGDPARLHETLDDIRNFYDPDRKIMVVSSYWKSEGEQRNYGKELLAQLGIGWCLVIDDDEFYNYDQMKMVVDGLAENPNYVLLTPQRVYWKNADFCIANMPAAAPFICRTPSSETIFDSNRNLTVYYGPWATFKADEIIMHHYSYVRTDEQLQRKLRTFSHAHEYPLQEWYQKVWLDWSPDMEDLHPNPAGRDTFKKAVSIKEVPWPLEKSGYVKNSLLETCLRASDFIQPLVPETEFDLEADPIEKARMRFLNRALRSIVKHYQTENTKVYMEAPYAVRALYSLCENTRATGNFNESSVVFILKSRMPAMHLSAADAPKLLIVDEDRSSPEFIEELMKFPFYRQREARLILASLEKVPA